MIKRWLIVGRKPHCVQSSAYGNLIYTTIIANGNTGLLWHSIPWQQNCQSLFSICVRNNWIYIMIVFKTAKRNVDHLTSQYYIQYVGLDLGMETQFVCVLSLVRGGTLFILFVGGTWSLSSFIPQPQID